jgi:hypothetical protein
LPQGDQGSEEHIRLSEDELVDHAAIAYIILPGNQVLDRKYIRGHHETAQIKESEANFGPHMGGRKWIASTFRKDRILS